MLREQGWDVEVIDFVEYWTLQQLKDYASTKITNNTKFINFTHLAEYWNNDIKIFCEWIKTTYPHLYILSHHKSPNNYYFIDHNAIDFHIHGYIEKSLPKLLHYLFSNGEPPIVFTLENKKIIFSNEHYFAAPHTNPLVFYEDRDFIHHNEWLSIEFSRGCKYKCSFCNFPVLGAKGDWTRSADSAKKQLQDAYDRFGVKNYWVNDETFNDTSEKLKKFADMTADLSFRPLFSGFIRPDLLHKRKEDREYLLKMNFLFQFYGVESFNHKSAASIGKGIDTEKLKECLLSVKEFFNNNSDNTYRGTISVIYGLPHETEATAEKGYTWVHSHWQGQSFKPNLLWIPKIDKKTIMRHGQSKLATNFTEYGYKEIHSKLLNHYIQKHRLQEAYNERAIYWQSKNGNIFTWNAFFKNIINKMQTADFRLDNLDITYLSLNDTIKDRLKIKSQHIIDKNTSINTIYSKNNNLAQNYISNKMKSVC
jgi:hypothetical protein